MVLLGFRHTKKTQEKSSKQELGNFVDAIQCGGGVIYSIVVL